MTLEELRKLMEWVGEHAIRPFVCPDCGGDYYGLDNGGAYGRGDGKPPGDCPMCNPPFTPLGRGEID